MAGDTCQGLCLTRHFLTITMMLVTRPLSSTVRGADDETSARARVAAARRPAMHGREPRDYTRGRANFGRAGAPPMMRACDAYFAGAMRHATSWSAMLTRAEKCRATTTFY